MSDKTLPENDLPDIQTKNPNPPDEQRLDSDSPFGDPPDHEPADPSHDTNPTKPRGRPARHGLRRRRLFVAPEDADRFERFHRHMMRELCAADHTECFIAEAIIAKRWLILHCDEAEAAAMRNAFAASELHTAALMESNAKDSPRDDDERFDHAMAASCTDEKVHLVLRYRTIHERALVRFETMLRQYRLIREARELAELRAQTESQTAYDRDRAASRADVVNHRGRDMECTNPTPTDIPSHDDSPEVAILKSEFPTPPRKPNIADTLANLSRRNPNPAGARIPSRTHTERESLPANDGEDSDDPTGKDSRNPACEKGFTHEPAPTADPDDPTTLALRAKILADIQDYYAHIQRQTPEPDAAPTGDAPALDISVPESESL